MAGDIVRFPVHTRDVVALCGGLVATAITVAVLRALPAVTPTTVGLTLLLVVLGTATLGRLWTAMAVALVATGAYNFFFFPPIGTFTIDDPQNWVAVAAFLVAAVIASKLSAAAQARAQEAIARRNEVTRLFDLTRDVLLTSEAAGAIDALARHVARRFELSRVAICLPADHRWRTYQGGNEEVRIDADALDNALAKARGPLEFDAHQRAYGGHVRVTDGDESVLILPLRHGAKAIGLLAAAAPAIDVATLDAVAGVVAIAIERTQFLGEREAAELVRQKAELAGLLLASLSHDLKTPLTAIRIAVENLRDELPVIDRRTQANAAIMELQRLNRLFQDILDMARIDAAAIHVERQWVTPADVVDAAAAHVRHALEGHPLNVEAEADAEVEIDPRVASVALSHLLENAAQYSPVGQTIAIRARAEADGLLVSVTDLGPGLDPAELDHVFERFFRGRTARHLSPGTGMGLAITSGLLTAVAGRVWAENATDAGARFTMVVPGARRPLALRV
jgi:two-component system, OmpR family, sensor histidine kinase KdpD